MVTEDNLACIFACKNTDLPVNYKKSEISSLARKKQDQWGEHQKL